MEKTVMDDQSHFSRTNNLPHVSIKNLDIPELAYPRRRRQIAVGIVGSNTEKAWFHDVEGI